MTNPKKPVRDNGTRSTTAEVTQAKPDDESLILAARQRSIERLRKMDGLDLDKAKVMRGAWR